MSRGGNKGFTILELLVSVAVMAVLLVIVASATGYVQKLYRSSSGKAEQFREARTAFDDYDDASAPTRYMRQSELRFQSGVAATLLGKPAPNAPSHAVFFQAPLGLTDIADYGGLDNLLNTWGYVLEFGNDSAIRPAFLGASVATRSRFRLLELRQPTKDLTLPGRTGNSTTWFSDAVNLTGADRRVSMVAENIILLVIWPLDPADPPPAPQVAPNYSYNTAPTGTKPQPAPEHQLPPTVRVTMVAIDEASARRLADINGNTAPALVDSTWFTTATDAQYASDMQALVDKLNRDKIAYRIFNSTVPIRGAKWSRN